uniref:CD226 molecule n=1 Tax=Myripristis murdjan TaxID=586833 RepID=A0A667ZPP4_9TELE
MEAVQKDHWYFMVLLIFLPFLKVTIQQREATVTVRLEEGMVLGCLCPWDGNFSMVSWTKVPDKNPIAVFHPEYGVAFSHLYRERIEFLRTTPMDGSITMRNVTHRDVGLYHCSVQTFPQGSWSRNIRIDDSSKTHDEPLENENTETPTPEVIEADTEVVAKRNDNLTISCNHEHNGTVYQVVVERLPHGQPWDIIGMCKVVDGGLVGEDFTERGRVSCADSLDVSLQLTDVTEEDGGFYRCHFSTDAGVQTTTVLLTVPSPGEFSLSVYMMYIYTGAGLAGLTLLIVILILPNYYENIPMHGRMGKKPKHRRDCPVYANLQVVQSHKTKRVSAL